MRKKTLKAICDKNPKHSEKVIKTVIGMTLLILNRKIQDNRNFNLNAPKLGRIYTHPNSKDIRMVKVRKRLVKTQRKFQDFSDTKLLF
jgi:hypothetical protein